MLTSDFLIRGDQNTNLCIDFIVKCDVWWKIRWAHLFLCKLMKTNTFFLAWCLQDIQWSLLQGQESYGLLNPIMIIMNPTALKWLTIIIMGRLMDH